MAARGRPREFDADTALDRAIDVFWRHGYEGASLAELTDAMGIAKPSLYAAFGDKESLFQHAVQRYVQTDMSYVDDALAEPTAHEVAAHYLRCNVAAITQAGRPHGCLSVQGGLACATDDRPIVEFLNASRAVSQSRFARRFEEAILAGDLDASESPDALAMYLNTITLGLAVQAGAGATRETLLTVAERALQSFPA
jgi:AcrR family transcriptional regulator